LYARRIPRSERGGKEKRPMKLLCGGQSGVDRAVLETAVARGLDYGGWCPKGGWAEDFPTPPGLIGRYPKLKETPLTDPTQRTEWNVRDADACMIIVGDGGLDVSAGTKLGGELAHRYRKPLLTVNLRQSDMVKHVALWLRVQRTRHGAGLTLAIGGPRESEAPGICARAQAFLAALLDSTAEG
jgi:Circularly permutated YpsA SLOG family